MLPMRFVTSIAALAVAGAVWGQAPPTDRPWAFLSASADEPADRAPAAPIRNILLRPNVELAFHVYVRNPTDNPQDVMVVVASGPGEADELARANVRAPARTTVRVPAPKVPAGTPADKPPPGGAVRGDLHLRVLDKAGDVLDRSAPLPIVMRTPSQYVEASATFVGEPGAAKNRLAVLVRDRSPQQPFAGPPAKVRLALAGDRIPSLIPDSARDGTFQASLSPGGEALLVANNLLFRDADRQGVIAVSVDGYDRAFLFSTDFSGTAPQPISTPALRIVAPRFAEPTKPVPIRLEVDNPPRDDAVVEFGIDRANSGTYVTKQYPSGDRERAVAAYWGGPSGGLTFVTKVNDRVEMLDAAGVYGMRRLRLRLLTQRDNQLEELNPPAPVYQDVGFDETPPAIASVSVKGDGAKRNQRAVLQAIGADPESGIDRVLFFLGDPPAADGKAPPGSRVIVASPPTEEGGPYTASLTLPDAKRFNLGVRFTNALGMSADKVVELELADPPEPKKTGTIKGLLVQGTDERPQKNVPVKLSDAKGMEVKTLDTNDKGEFKFEDVAPGKYTITAAVPRDRTKAMKEVSVEAGQVMEVKLALKR
jgi:hypothetical protein